MAFPRFHISLYVSDIEKSLSFYETLFNKKAEKARSDYFKFVLDQPALVISFVLNKNGVKSKFGHLGYQLESEVMVNNEMKRLTDLGFSIKEEKDVNCCYARQDKFWVQDPDGYAWELYCFHEDVEHNDPHAMGGTSEEGECCVPADLTGAGAACIMPAEKPKMSIKDFIEKQKKGGCC